MKAYFPAVMASCILSALSCAGQSWVPTGAPVIEWAGIACSADGSRIMGISSSGGSYISTNSGTNWTTNHLARLWSSVAVSADGTKWVVTVSGTTAGFIYTSTNLGATWMTNNSPVKNWKAVASSSDGTRLVAAADPGNLYSSSDSGTTWSTNGAPSGSWTAVASSADGETLAALMFNGSLYISTNAGANWTSNSVGGGRLSMGSIAFSANAGWLFAGAGGNGGSFFISTNLGATWATNQTPRTVWDSLACSADGSKLVGGSYNSESTYVSVDHGNTWKTNQTPPYSWGSVTTSADGSKLYAASILSQGIATLQITPAPRINASFSGGNLTLSWVLPSTNFVLQQNLDLTTSDWVTLTNQPTLNFSNLENQVSLPSTGGGFFRLISQ